MTDLPQLPFVLNTSDNDVPREFYDPCLRWAKWYDRGVGYFTSGWLRDNATGMSLFAANGGKARWLTSPILEEADLLQLFTAMANGTDQEQFTQILMQSVEALKDALEHDTLNALAWLIADGVIEFRFAIPAHKLAGGDFHDKFGIFSDGQGNRVSFNGSQNDSHKGNLNYESIKVFPSWSGAIAEAYATDDQKRFNRLWEPGGDPNMRIYSLPEAVRQQIIHLKTDERPYHLPQSSAPSANQWRHQDEAVEAFLAAGHGILEMATGTGKTRTALKIAAVLLSQGKIDSVVVSTYGTDLLDQWRMEILKNLELPVFRYYGSHKQLSNYVATSQGSALLVSRTPETLGDTLHFLKPVFQSRTLLIVDEVHGMGSPGLVNALSGKLGKFGYCLGLSATPEREYDDAGNEFIRMEIGEVVFQFGLEDAIRRGILCEFDYLPLEYELTDEDRKRMRNLIAAHSMKKRNHIPVDDTVLYRALADVRKVSEAKLPVFEDFLRQHPEVLNRSIIFVATKEFGLKVQEMLINYLPSYHTYFAEDDRDNLKRFAAGELDCLLTSHRISEGIDIKTVDNIILLSTDRARLETIQRIGRSLRTDPTNPNKRARVVDLVVIPPEDKELQSSADQERREWLVELAAVHRED